MIERKHYSPQGWLITRREPMLKPGVIITCARASRSASRRRFWIGKSSRPWLFKSGLPALHRRTSVRHALRWIRRALSESSEAKDYKLRSGSKTPNSFRTCRQTSIPTNLILLAFNEMFASMLGSTRLLQLGQVARSNSPNSATAPAKKGKNSLRLSRGEGYWPDARWASVVGRC